MLERPLDGREQPGRSADSGSDSSAADPCASESSAPALTRLSTHASVDLARVELLAQVVERRMRPSRRRTSMIARAADSPTFFTAPRPKRTPSGVTVKASSLLLTSGASTFTPRSRHSPRYIASFAVFCDSMVSSAAMKCAG